ncbi:hypothetical protein AAGW05_06150 [Arthrobacter sp. LAPM80]|uniref:hypothetical protein n=1 Tax=Arthrobacter sp. LAPM80 TaxID=3141788 RepID=UPI00398B9F84
MTQITLTIPVDKYRIAHTRRYDTIELERQTTWQIDQLPSGATVRVDTGGLPPIPDNLAWHRYGLEYVIDSPDVTTARQWSSMLDQHYDALAGQALDSWGA